MRRLPVGFKTLDPISGSLSNTQVHQINPLLKHGFRDNFYGLILTKCCVMFQR